MIAQRLESVVASVTAAARVLVRSGLLFELRAPGARAAARALGAGAKSQSQIYEFHAMNTPDKTAVVWAPPSAAPAQARRLTFRELDQRVSRVAAGLRRRGLGRGDSVVLMMRNRPEFLEAQAGAGRAGASAVSVSWRSTGAELAYIAEHSAAKAIFFEADLWPAVEQARRGGLASRNLVAVGGPAPGCDRYEEDFLAAPGPHPRRRAEEGAAVVMYTSGTTGKPKGAVRRFPRSALYTTLRFLAETPMRVDDVHLVACPLYHATALGFLAMSGLLGNTAVLLGEFTPLAFVEHVERFHVTTTAVVPTMLHRVLALGDDELRKHDLRSLRVVFSGGAPLSGQLAARAMDRFGDVVFNFYGATETGIVTLAKPADLRAAPGTIGRAVPGNEVRLLGDDGAEVAPGEVGELYARSGMLVAGYHRDAESTRASMRDGFFSVGDLARRDGEGRYFLEGRKRDMIISGGVNVYPAEVEAVLEAHPEVAEAAVVGVEDAEWGERVRAFVVRRGAGGGAGGGEGGGGGGEGEGGGGGGTAELDDAAVKAWCRARLSGAKVPREVIFLDALPRNPTGKVLKRELRARG